MAAWQERPRVWASAGWIFLCASCGWQGHAAAQPNKSPAKAQAKKSAPNHARGPRVQLPEAVALRSEQPIGEIRDCVQRGDRACALTKLEALPADYANRPDLRYLKARLWAENNRTEDALSVLPEDLSNLPNLVARDIRIRRALWLARTGHCTEARPMLTALTKYDGQDAELTLRAADCAVLQGDIASAFVLLRDVRAGGSKRFALRQTLAKLLAQTGDKNGAIHELRGLWVEFPTHSRIGDIENELRALMPDWQPSNDEHFGRADHWLDAARPENALAELEQVVLPKSGKKPQPGAQAVHARYLHLRGMSLFRMRNKYPEAAKVLNQAAALGGSTQAEDAYHAARALARSDRDAEAVRAYNQFAKRFPRDRLTADALHDAAWLELRHDMPGGEAHMRAILQRAERLRAKQTVADCLWDLALHAFQTAHYERGLPLFERYATTSDDPMVKGRGLYWAARSAALSGKQSLALTHYREAMAVEPLHWYSLLAKARVDAAGEDPGPPFGASQGDGPSVDAPPIELHKIRLPPAADFYAQLGLYDEAVRCLRLEEPALRESRDEGGLSVLLSAYHALGEYTRPYHLAERERDGVLMRPLTPLARPIWDALFPRPYLEEVSNASRASSIEPELVFAVIRKESAFNPSVVSNADAIGLMQLITPTAKSMAEELGVQSFERDMLYEPAMNIQLGSHYLAKLVTRYRGNAVPAIAAYNAGEHRVDPWLKRSAGKDKTVEMDWFVENIPIDQTRNYVKRVVSSWARYAYLEKQGKEWPLQMPMALKL
jgi:soluble lytic murein transglycosylase